MNIGNNIKHFTPTLYIIFKSTLHMFFSNIFKPLKIKRFDYKMILEENNSFLNYNDIIYDALKKITLDKIKGVILVSLKREFINIIKETILNTCYHFIYHLIR